MVERERIASGLWTSIAAADQAGPHASSCPTEGPRSFENNDEVCLRILEGLEFEDMMARESQIQDPFPETFQWLLGDGGSRSGEPSSIDQPTGFKEWLESATNETPFWITGNPASGKSTLMKFICTNTRVQTHLRLWSRDYRLLMCSIYFWNPGSSGQKSQVGLLRTILHQLLRQRPDLCQLVTPRRYIYFQLAGTDALEPQDWTLEELRDCISRFISKIEDTDRLAVFLDGLDEYEGDLGGLISFLKRLHRDFNVKLCVSSRPWNVIKDEFNTYPSLRMELLTKPDIERYVRTRIGNCRAFQELRTLDARSVEKLEFQIIYKADGVFLWVVLVVEKLVNTAQDNNDLHNIWKVFDTLPPGLEDLYGSMRQRLSPDLLEGGSRMYQLLFRWNETLDFSISALDFWMAINCHDPAQEQHYTTADETVEIVPALERRLAGHTGGVLQVSSVAVKDGASGSSPIATVGFLHRTVFDWLQGIRSTIVNDGPMDYDPSLVLASVLVSRLNSLRKDSQTPLTINHVFSIGRACNDSPGNRAKLLRIIEMLQVEKLRDSGRFLTLSTRARSHLSDAVIRAYIAILSACAPYLQAKLESDSHATGLESSPRFLHKVPTRLWGKHKREWLSLIIDAALEVDSDPTPRVLNMKLKTFEILLQVQFAPHRNLASRIEDKVKADVWPKEYWKALLDMLRGRAPTELTILTGDVLRRTPRLRRGRRAILGK
jgi:hypothetical protein